jgi:diaminohydroxyphosphoribosylaminopyrimidine deaminase/5-amino-6-(5-phosphoribosylamino)uracil reductase
VARVVTATEDPDSRVAGRGHRQLAAAGVEVTSGVLAGEARSLNAEYFHRVRTGRAFAVMKAAVTLDGRLGADGGDSRWITGPEARERAHELRDRYDAVLVGRGTLERDDPLLTVRGITNGRDPVTVVALSELTPPSPRRLWERAKSGAQVIVAATDGGGGDVWRQWANLGVEILTLGVAEGKRVRLEDLLRALAGRGLNSVLIEGGEKIHTSCLKAGVIDRAHVFVSPRILGGTDGPRLVGDLGLRRVADAFTLADPEVEVLGRDLLLTGRVVAGKGGG